eukprot:TRINITY_DN2029_c0_g2_i1.p1 TRINITY_DN2029_c0_g2~~TRINITY_DN2029_c0_g2_i1.p1  ORF type:complete len:187 (+),score=25.07 TRINITY_DN2029_c0_g2_i1:66-626(+)
MLSFFFGIKKPKVTPTIRQSYIQPAPPQTTGNVAVYTFTPSAEEVKAEFRLYKPTTSPSKGYASDLELLNEKKISRLIARYSSISHKARKEEQKKPRVKEEINLTVVKAIRQVLNRITRYSNNRLYGERQGFASTLSDCAELIGVENTVKFLLKPIAQELVCFCSHVVPRHHANQRPHAATSHTHC